MHNQSFGDSTVRGDSPLTVFSRIGYFLSGPLPASIDEACHVKNVIAAFISETIYQSRF